LDDSHATYSLIYLFQKLRDTKKIFLKTHPDLLKAENKDKREKIEILARAFFQRVTNAVIAHP